MDPPVMGRVPRRRSGQRERGELSKIAKNRRRWAASSAAFLGCQATDPRRRGLPRCGVPRRCATPVRARYATDRGAFRTVADRSAAIDPQRNNALRPRRVLDEKDQPNRTTMKSRAREPKLHAPLRWRWRTAQTSLLPAALRMREATSHDVSRRNSAQALTAECDVRYRRPMHLAFSPAEARVRDAIRAFLVDAMPPPSAIAEDGWIGGFSPEFSRRMGAAGWIGMTWPRAYGGGERSYVERAIVTEECLRAGAPTAAHWTGDRQIGPSLLAHGTEEQKREILPRIVRGELVFCLGMSEPGAGSDL